MDNRLIYQAAALGGLVAALTDTVPVLNFINCLCCLGIALGGAGAVLYLRKQANVEVFSAPEIVHVGLLTGLIGAFISFVFQYAVYEMYGNWQVDWMLNMVENMEEIPPMWDSIYEELQRPEYKYFAGSSLLIRSLIIFPIFTYLGARITNQILIRRHDQKNPPMA